MRAAELRIEGNRARSPGKKIFLRNVGGLQPGVSPAVGGDHVLAADCIAPLHEVDKGELVPVLVEGVWGRLGFRVLFRRLSGESMSDGVKNKQTRIEVEPPVLQLQIQLQGGRGAE